MLLERVLTNPSIKSAVEPWVPKRAANWLRRLRTRTMRQAPTLTPELRSELTQPFRDDIRRTADLIGRSLDHWL
jgi:hypothetical protein